MKIYDIFSKTIFIMKIKLMSSVAALMFGLTVWSCKDSLTENQPITQPSSAREVVVGKGATFDGQMLVFGTEEEFVNTVESLQNQQGESTQAMLTQLESEGLKTEEEISIEANKRGFDINAPLKKYGEGFAGFTSLLSATELSLKQYYSGDKLDPALDPEKDLPTPAVQALVNKNFEVNIAGKIVSLRIKLPYKGCSPFQYKNFTVNPTSKREVKGWMLATPFSVGGATYARMKVFLLGWIPAFTRTTRTCKEGIVFSAWDCKTIRNINSSCVSFPAASAVIQFFPLMGVKPGTNHWRTKHEVPGWGFSQTINN
jgi:hypothetical protein